MPKNTSLSDREGHRDRMRKKFLVSPESFNDGDLLEMILWGVIPRRDTKQIAKDLINTFGGLHRATAVDIKDMVRVDGMGLNAAIQLKAINQFVVRKYAKIIKDTPIFYEMPAVENYIFNTLDGKGAEEFHVLCLDRKRKLIKDCLHSIGTIDWSPVFPRKILQDALDWHASSVLIIHNHPGGIENFSDEDVTMTNHLIVLLQNAAIEFYDHYLVVNGKIISWKSKFPDTAKPDEG